MKSGDGKHVHRSRRRKDRAFGRRYLRPSSEQHGTVERRQSRAPSKPHPHIPRKEIRSLPVCRFWRPSPRSRKPSQMIRLHHPERSPRIAAGGRLLQRQPPRATPRFTRRRHIAPAAHGRNDLHGDCANVRSEADNPSALSRSPTTGHISLNLQIEGRRQAIRPHLVRLPLKRNPTSLRAPCQRHADQKGNQIPAKGNPPSDDSTHRKDGKAGRPRPQHRQTRRGEARRLSADQRRRQRHTHQARSVASPEHLRSSSSGPAPASRPPCSRRHR